MALRGVAFSGVFGRGTIPFTRKPQESVIIGSEGNISFEYVCKILPNKANLLFTCPEDINIFVREIESKKVLPGEVETTSFGISVNLELGKTEAVVQDFSGETFIRVSKIQPSKLKVYINASIDVPVHRQEVYVEIQGEQ